MQIDEEEVRVVFGEADAVDLHDVLEVAWKEFA